LNWTITRETPSSVVERISSIPLTVLTASSMGLVTRASVSSGAAPGRNVVTITVGTSTLGKRSTPSRMYENHPSTTSTPTNIVAKTGRRTHKSAKNTTVTS